MRERERRGQADAALGREFVPSRERAGLHRPGEQHRKLEIIELPKVAFALDLRGDIDGPDSDGCVGQRGLVWCARKGELMKFFIDTADVKEIREAAAMGLVDGVTTNHSLLARTGRKVKEVLLEICDIVKGPVSAEVVRTKYDDMMREGLDYAALRSQIGHKIPM